jgi:hypothetical protein
MAAGDFLIVVEVIRGNYFGWLPNEAWNWINEQYNRP